MTPLEIALASIDAAVLSLWFCLWFSTRLVTARAKTVPEAMVRLLYGLARRLNALAEALDSGILAYREMRREPVRTRAETERELREAAKLQVIDQQEAS